MTDSLHASAAAALAPNLIVGEADGGRIAENILQFARLLRSAGMPVGPDRVILATQAVLAAGIERPQILYWTLHASLVSRPEHREIFDQAFYLFWKDPGFLQQMLSVMLPSFRDDSGPKQAELSRRLRDPLLADRPRPEMRPEERIELDMSGTWSADEQLKAKDQARARAAIQRMDLILAEMPTRRFTHASRSANQIDLRRVLRETASRGSDHVALHAKARRRRAPPAPRSTPPR